MLFVAVRDCSEALRLDPIHVKARLRRGTALLRAEKLEDAISDFDIVIAYLEDTPSQGAHLSRVAFAVFPWFRYQTQASAALDFVP